MLIRFFLRASCLFGAGAALALPLLPPVARAIAVSPATTVATTAATRVGEAEVREGAGGLPCFTIAEREERRSGAPNFEAISVTEVPGIGVAGVAGVAGSAGSAGIALTGTAAARTRSPGPARAVVWSMTMPAGRTFPLMFSMCVPYGGRVAALPQRSAELLEAGKLYEVAIAVRTDGAAGNSAQPQSLVARFCLLRRADGGNSVALASACARPRKR